MSRANSSDSEIRLAKRGGAWEERAAVGVNRLRPVRMKQFTVQKINPEEATA